MNKLLKTLALALILVLAYNCEKEDNEERFGSFDSYVSFVADRTDALDVGNERPGYTGVDVAVGSGSLTETVRVFANSTSGSDRTFGVMVNTAATTMPDAAYNMPATVTIPANSREGALNIEFIESALDFIATDLVIMFDPTSEANTGPQLTITAGLVCPPENQVVFALTLDNWPNETTWSITDPSGATVAAGGPFVNPDDDFLTKTSDLCLVTTGTYTLTVNDSYGDGIAPGGFDLTVGGSAVYTGEQVTGTGVSVNFIIN